MKLLKTKLIKTISINCAVILIVSTIAFATTGKKQINVEYDNIKINIDGNNYVAKDVNGNVVEPFTYNGTTFLPVRGVANAFGKNVGWDDSTKTVIITSSVVGAEKKATSMFLAMRMYHLVDTIEDGMDSLQTAGQGLTNSYISISEYKILKETVDISMEQFYSFQDSYEEINLLCRNAVDSELNQAAETMNGIMYYAELAYGEIYKFFNTNDMEYILSALSYANSAKKSIADVQSSMMIYSYMVFD